MDRPDHTATDARETPPRGGADASPAEGRGEDRKDGDARSEEQDRPASDDMQAEGSGGGSNSEPAKGDGEAPPEKKGKRRLWLWLIIGVVVIAAIVGGVYYWIYSSQYETTDDAFIDGDIVRIAAQVAGQLVAVPVEDNAHVKKGDLLAKIDPSGPEAQLALQRASLDQAKAAVVEAEAKIGQAKAEVAQQRATLNGLNVQAENARTQASRLQELQKKAGSAAISQQALDDALAQARQAEANAEAAKTNVDNAESGVAAAEAALKSANAQVEAAKAQVANAEVTVGHLTISAPIDGQVVQKDVNVGSYVEPGMQTMALVPEQLYVTANFKETQLADIRLGAKVDLSVDAFPDVEFKGTVRSIQHGAGQAFQLLPPQNATGNFVKVVQRVPVRISIDSPSPSDYPLGPGMSVVPSVHVD